MILLTLILGALLQEAQAEKVFRFGVEVRTVFVDVFVSRDGNPVSGLTARDFEIFDNDARQEIDLVDPQDVFLSAMLILDTSASVSGPKLAHLQKAAHAFLRRLRKKDEAGLMMFNQYCHLRQAMGEDLRLLHVALDHPTRGGYTGLHDALYTGLKLVGEARGRPMVVLFTDGKDNASWLTDRELLDVARESEAIVHVIGIKPSDELPATNGSAKQKGSSRYSDSADRAEDLLRDLAGATGGRVWYAKTSAELEQVFLKVLEEMETRYLLSYQLVGAPEEGWHELDVKLKKQKGETIRTRLGYMVITTEN
jgi:VWFA-related protein